MHRDPIPQSVSQCAGNVIRQGESDESSAKIRNPRFELRVIQFRMCQQVIVFTLEAIQFDKGAIRVGRDNDTRGNIQPGTDKFAQRKSFAADARRIVDCDLIERKDVHLRAKNGPLIRAEAIPFGARVL
jgi:hypothetical protein